MAYVKIIYQDSPSTATPLNAQNLNHMDDGIFENDRRLNDLAVHNVKSFNGREGDIVSANGDYDISQIAPTTGATVGQIPIVVNVGTEEEPELQFELDDVPQTGHTIQGADGTNLAQEPTMQFADLHTSDDSVHLKTVIQAVKAVIQSDYSSETEDGIYLVTDGEGATIEPASDDYVEVTADGVKTWRQLYNSLYSLIDTTKLSIFSKIEQSNQIFTFINSDTSNLIFIRSTVSQNTYGNKRLFNAQIKLNSSTSVLETLELYENNTNNYDDRSTDQPSNGTKITLYYGNKKATVDLQTTANRCWYDSNNTVKQKIDDIGKAVSLGYKQGTGTKTLSEPISNFRFLYISVGYYNAGVPTYGSITIPVSCISATGLSTDRIHIPCYETTASEVVIGFNDVNTLNVESIYSNGRYVNVKGIK